jgi:hypothetical protein
MSFDESDRCLNFAEFGGACPTSECRRGAATAAVLDEMYLSVVYSMPSA